MSNTVYTLFLPIYHLISSGESTHCTIEAGFLVKISKFANPCIYPGKIKELKKKNHTSHEGLFHKQPEVEGGCNRKLKGKSCKSNLKQSVNLHFASNFIAFQHVFRQKLRSRWVTTQTKKETKKQRT